MERVEIGVDGMSCGGCALSVEKALRAIAGVDTVEVDLGRKSVRVEGTVLDRPRLAQAIEDAGYDVRPA
jgi:copper chaperone CopZ